MSAPKADFVQKFELFYFDRRKLEIGGVKIKHADDFLQFAGTAHVAKVSEEIAAFQAALGALQALLKITLQIEPGSRIFNTDEALVIKRRVAQPTRIAQTITDGATYAPDFEAMTRVKDFLLDVVVG